MSNGNRVLQTTPPKDTNKSSVSEQLQTHRTSLLTFEAAPELGIAVLLNIFAVESYENLMPAASRRSIHAAQQTRHRQQRQCPRQQPHRKCQLSVDLEYELRQERCSASCFPDNTFDDEGDMLEAG